MDRVSNALSAIKDAGASSASSVGGFFSSTAESGVSAFKGTTLGESFFKNNSVTEPEAEAEAEAEAESEPEAEAQTQPSLRKRYTLNQIPVELFPPTCRGPSPQSVFRMN